MQNALYFEYCWEFMYFILLFYLHAYLPLAPSLFISISFVGKWTVGH